MTRDEAIALIEKHFAEGGLPPKERETLFDHIRSHPDLKRLYDRHAQIELALAEGDHVLAQRIASSIAAGPATAPVELDRPRRLRRRAFTAVALAAAAVLLLVLLPPPKDGPLPAYDLEMTGGRDPFRSDPAEGPARFGPKTRFSALLRPSTKVGGDVDARAALVAGGRLYPVTTGWRRSATGALKLEGAAGELFDAPPGSYELVVVVGRPFALPPPEALHRTEPGPSRRVLRTSIELLAR